MTTLESIYNGGGSSVGNSGVVEETTKAPYNTYYIHNKKTNRPRNIGGSFVSSGVSHLKKTHGTMTIPISTSDRDKHLSLDAAEELYSKLKVKPSLLNPVLMRATKTQMQYLNRSIDSSGQKGSTRGFDSSVYQIPMQLKKHPKFVKVSEETVPSPSYDNYRKVKSSSLVEPTHIGQYLS
mmetsp:Transcript_10805/g.16423  ORF Transcript_10805/g.16423 Transcript_10805/m.16423 type:complete len:180 (+) Transcript_10805:2684-3223(+)